MPGSLDLRAVLSHRHNLEQNLARLNLGSDLDIRPWRGRAISFEADPRLRAFRSIVIHESPIAWRDNLARLDLALELFLLQLPDFSAGLFVAFREFDGQLQLLDALRFCVLLKDILPGLSDLAAIRAIARASDSLPVLLSVDSASAIASLASAFLIAASASWSCKTERPSSYSFRFSAAISNAVWFLRCAVQLESR